MAHAVWSGSLSFGLVSLPVSLVTATESHTMHFHQIERGTSDRVRVRRVNESTGKEVPYDRIVKGYDTGDGHVVVEPDELDEIAPGRSRSIDITGFAELADIEPVYFDTTYFVGPKSKTYSKVYGLLLAALEEAGRAGIATMTMRQKEYLVAVHAEGGVIVLHTLHWADEVRDPHRTLANLPRNQRNSSKELKAAVQLIEAMAIDWDPHDYRDTSQERVRELVEAKESGEEPAKGEPAPETTKAVDLMEALQASVDRAKRGGAGKKRGPAGAKKKPARKTAKKSTAKTAAKAAKQPAKKTARKTAKSGTGSRATQRKAS